MLRSGKGRKQNVNDFPLPYLSLSSPRIAFGSWGWGSGRKQKGTKGMGWGWGLRGIFEFDFNVASSSAQLRTRRMVLQGRAKIIVLESEKTHESCISSITQTPSVDHGEESLNFIDSRLIFLVPSSMSTTPALQDGVSTYDAHINFGFFDPSSSLHAYLRRLSKKLVNSSADVINGVPLSREELWALARKLQ